MLLGTNSPNHFIYRGFRTRTLPCCAIHHPCFTTFSNIVFQNKRKRNQSDASNKCRYYRATTISTIIRHIYRCLVTCPMSTFQLLQHRLNSMITYTINSWRKWRNKNNSSSGKLRNISLKSRTNDNHDNVKNPSSDKHSNITQKRMKVKTNKVKCENRNGEKTESLR